jgi:hypothetical protein
MAGLAAAVVAPFPQTPAAASCTGSSLRWLDQLVLQPGSTASVQGENFVDGCRDTMSCSGVPGCQKCRYDEPPEQPQQDIGLELRQHGRAWTVATADAGTQGARFGQVTWTFAVPEGIEPGRARLVAGGTSPVIVRVGAG